MKHDLIAIYYAISELMGDEVECIADAIKKMTHTKARRSIIVRQLEGLHLTLLEKELEQMYSMQAKELKSFHIKWNLHEKEHGYQTTIFDFIGDN